MNQDTRPLADLMRPNTIDEILGQSALLGENGLVRRMVENQKISNLILWGPPGCGKTTIARALANDPKFILLDEPFAGIDPIAVNEIRGLVSQLKNRGLGVIITDHNVRETLGITDRSYVLHDGKILKHGTSDEIIRDEMVKKVYLGEDFTM